jgi:hypothetical protein
MSPASNRLLGKSAGSSVKLAPSSSTIFRRPTAMFAPLVNRLHVYNVAVTLSIPGGRDDGAARLTRLERASPIGSLDHRQIQNRLKPYAPASRTWGTWGGALQADRAMPALKCVPIKCNHLIDRDAKRPTNFFWTRSNAKNACRCTPQVQSIKI